MKKIAIIGHFGGKNLFFDGQTVKTLTLYKELKATGLYDIKIIDTYYNKENKFKLLFDTLKNVILCKDIIVLLSHNGMKTYFPLLYFFAKVFKKNVYHDIIGGNLPELISKHKNWLKYLNSFKVNWIELHSVKEKLDDLGLKNVEVLPNFKEIKAIPKSEITVSEDGVLRVCTFSRVMKEKGIEDAIEAVKEINNSGKKCVLSIFGQVDPGYKQRFEKLSKDFPEYIKYGGVIDFNKSVETLSKFDLLLFPSYWSGEGFPGTFLDAFASGLPIVAKSNPTSEELISDDITGFIYNGNSKECIKSIMMSLYSNPEKLYTMKNACIQEYYKYEPEVIMKSVLDMLNS